MTARLIHPWAEEIDREIYVWRIPPEPKSREIERALGTIQAWVTTLDGPYGWINDTREIRITTLATERKMIADHLHRVEPYSIRYCAGMSTIITNSMVRGMATAIAWLYEYPFAVHYSSSPDAAIAWVRDQMASARRDAKS